MRTSTRHGVRAALILGLGLALVMTGCSSGADPTSTLPATTTTTRDETTTSTAADMTTSTAAVADLVVEIVSPPPLATFLATIDLGNGRLAAPVRLVAQVSAPDGESIEFAWASDIDGPLGGGPSLDAELSNDRSDVVSHLITVTAVSLAGSRGTATVEVIVRVPSN